MTSLSLILGGLGLFLLGLDDSTRTFREEWGPRSRRLFGRMSRSTGASFLLGTVLSALSQSSTAATALTIGLVNAGVLSLAGAVVVMMGASVGPSLMTFLISVDVTSYAPLILGVAVFGERFTRGPFRQLSAVVRGLALILTGMALVKLGVVPLTARADLQELFAAAGSSPWLLGLGVLVVTAGTQSSSLVVALAMVLLSQGLLPPEGALPVVLGSHVGSSATVLLAGLGGRPQARALAWASLIYKIVGVGAALLLASPIQGVFASLTFPLPLRFALLQGIILWGNAALLLPLAPLLAQASQGVARLFARETPGTPLYLDDAALPFPSLALALLSREMVRLASALEQLLTLTLADRSRPRDRSALQEGLPSLAEACADFLLSIPSGADRGVEASREELFDSLRSLSQLTTQLVTRFAPRSDALGYRLTDEGPDGVPWKDFASALVELVRHSLGTFVLGEREPSPLARRSFQNFHVQENLLRARLRGSGEGRVTRETMEALEWVDEASSLARSAQELVS
ncbi:MAG TPA: Na/Pi symporter [Synergistaceae bacterium]|nr:Na/Pi symporter [Synergistaceae bacterium]HQF90645.1 Na/Pi symporter [Synergistaceae bacterium]HQH77384.1 Na/Pi symporter [Synergistaceae bacterium]HQK24388.1 Na/Pi symporter [Synergistaceae bacterium]